MSQYSEMMGSFIRTGNYPLEANYIFANEAELKTYYSDPINATMLHKGWLKVVENDGTGKQALYWVAPKQTNDELEFVKLISWNDTQELYLGIQELEASLNSEISARKEADNAIWGTGDPTNIPEELNSILDISLVISEIKENIVEIYSELSDSDTSIHNSLKTELKATVGTVEDDIVSHLNTLPYKSLSEVSQALNKFLNTVDNTTTKINTLPELMFFLEGYEDSQKLRHVLMDLKAEISGTPLPSTDFSTLRAIEDFVRILKADSENTDKNLQSELDQTLVGVGLSADGSFSPDKSTNYLQDATSIMNALHTLDNLMAQALRERPISTQNNDVVDLAVRKELEGYVIGAELKLSNVIGNDLVKKEDGLYFNVKSTYEDGTLSLYVNDKLIAQHVLGFSSIVESAVYDPSQEALVIVFKLLNGDRQTITVPVGALIREWEVDNTNPDKVIELHRETSVSGTDKLSADVRLYSDKSNILKKVGNTLYVDGRSTNITHNDQLLSEVIETLKTNTATNAAAVADEVGRASGKEAELKQNIDDNKVDIESKLDAVEDATNLELTRISGTVSNEVNRATEAENNIKQSVAANKTEIDALKQADVVINNKLGELQTADVQLDGRINLEELRAKGEEDKLDRRLTSAESELSSVSQSVTDELNRALTKESELASDISTLDNKVDMLKLELQQEIHLVEDNVASLIASKAEQADVDALKTVSENLSQRIQEEYSRALNAEIELSRNVQTETTRATTAESNLSQTLQTETTRAISAEATIKQGLQDEIARATAQEVVLATELAKKVEKVAVNQLSELSYAIVVDDITVGTINIPEDQFLESVEVVNTSTLRFVFDTRQGKVTTDIDLSEVVQNAIASLVADIADIREQLWNKADIDSPIFTGVPQVQTSPDSSDASQRIPSTNWVRDRVQEVMDYIEANMPYSKAQLDILLAEKADLVDGIVPKTQLPELTWIEVE